MIFAFKFVKRHLWETCRAPKEWALRLDPWGTPQTANNVFQLGGGGDGGGGGNIQLCKLLVYSYLLRFTPMEIFHIWKLASFCNLCQVWSFKSPVRLPPERHVYATRRQTNRSRSDCISIGSGSKWIIGSLAQFSRWRRSDMRVCWIRTFADLPALGLHASVGVHAP